MFVALLAMTSCEKSLLAIDENGTQGEVATVTISASAESLTRAMADASSATPTYYLEVYKDGNIYIEQKTNNDGQFSVRLVTNQEFTLVAWADYDEEGSVDYWDTSAGLESVTLKDYAINTPNRDAFSGAEVIELEGNESIEMELTRPLARINIATNDIDAIKSTELIPTHVQLVYTNVLYSEFDVIGKDVVDGQALISKTTGITEVIDGVGSISADYFMVPSDGCLLDFTAIFYYNGNEITTYDFKSIPVKVNYQTNISGNLLTKTGDIQVELDNKWSEPAEDVVYLDATSPEAATVVIADAIAKGGVEYIVVSIGGANGGEVEIPETDIPISLAFTQE